MSHPHKVDPLFTPRQRLLVNVFLMGDAWVDAHDVVRPRLVKEPDLGIRGVDGCWALRRCVRVVHEII